jgi:hypothetical protein
MTNLPSAKTPLYNHSLLSIEKWLKDLGCEQNEKELHCWLLETASWKAEIYLDIDKLAVCYFDGTEDGNEVNRVFKYSLSRQDIEDAVLIGP